MRVTIVDYGLGNLWSVKNAFEVIGADVVISSNPSLVESSQCLVLPGVGNFGKAMENIHARSLYQALDYAVVNKKVPILGICLGMQLFASFSEEAPGVGGFGWIPGVVKKITDRRVRLPHMGFNTALALKGGQSKFFSSSDNGSSDFYFVHSYYFHPDDDRNALAQTTYGLNFISAVHKENILGVQFHPEKSQSSGLKLISEFLKFSKGA